jgi:hypothetical protein
MILIAMSFFTERFVSELFCSQRAMIYRTVLLARYRRIPSA